LTGYCDAFFIFGPHHPVLSQGIISCIELFGPKQLAAYHHSSTSLACLAMNASHIPLILSKPLIDVFAELLYQFKWWRLMIFKRVLYDLVVKL